MIEFCECANYRGAPQAKEEGGKFFWRVTCDVEEEQWSEIPAYLWAALQQHRGETADGRKPWNRDGHNQDLADAPLCQNQDPAA